MHAGGDAEAIARNRRLVGACQAIIDGAGLPAHTVQFGAKGCITWSPEPVRNYRDYKATDFDLAFAQWIHGINRGVLLPPGLDEQWLISVMHDDADEHALRRGVREFVAELTADRAVTSWPRSGSGATSASSTRRGGAERRPPACAADAERRRRSTIRRRRSTGERWPATARHDVHTTASSIAGQRGRASGSRTRAGHDRGDSRTRRCRRAASASRVGGDADEEAPATSDAGRSAGCTSPIERVAHVRASPILGLEQGDGRQIGGADRGRWSTICAPVICDRLGA